MAPALAAHHAISSVRYERPHPASTTASRDAARSSSRSSARARRPCGRLFKNLRTWVGGIERVAVERPSARSSSVGGEEAQRLASGQHARARGRPVGARGGAELVAQRSCRASIAPTVAPPVCYARWRFARSLDSLPRPSRVRSRRPAGSPIDVELARVQHAVCAALTAAGARSRRSPPTTPAPTPASSRTPRWIAAGIAPITLAGRAVASRESPPRGHGRALAPRRRARQHDGTGDARRRRLPARRQHDLRRPAPRARTPPASPGSAERSRHAVLQRGTRSSCRPHVLHFKCVCCRSAAIASCSRADRRIGDRVSRRRDLAGSRPPSATPPTRSRLCSRTRSPPPAFQARTSCSTKAGFHRASRSRPPKRARPTAR